MGVLAGRWLRLYTYTVLLLLYIPILVMFLYSFDKSFYASTWEGFTTRWYRLMLRDTRLYAAMANSITVALASAVVSVLLALPASRLGRSRVKRVIEASAIPPVVMPDIAEAVSLLLLLIALGFTFGWTTVFIGHTAFNIAYAYLTLSPMSGDVRRYEEAARSLGAGRARILARITIPLLMPGIVAAFMLAFIMSFTDFVKTLFTKGPGFETIPILIWNRARRPGLSEFSSQNALNAVASSMVAVTLLTVLLYTMLRRYRSRRNLGTG